MDFSCGSNEFLHLLSRAGAAAGLRGLQMRAYDILSPAAQEGFVRKSWFEVTTYICCVL